VTSVCCPPPTGAGRSQGDAPGGEPAHCCSTGLWMALLTLAPSGLDRQAHGLLHGRRVPASGGLRPGGRPLALPRARPLILLHKPCPALSCPVVSSLCHVQVSDSQGVLKHMADEGWDPQPLFRTMLQRISISDQTARLAPLPEGRDGDTTWGRLPSAPACIVPRLASSHSYHSAHINASPDLFAQTRASPFCSSPSPHRRPGPPPAAAPAAAPLPQVRCEPIVVAPCLHMDALAPSNAACPSCP
jgi:hypothetical protein